jgi:hypothetical protein
LKDLEIKIARIKIDLEEEVAQGVPVTVKKEDEEV